MDKLNYKDVSKALTMLETLEAYANVIYETNLVLSLLDAQQELLKAYKRGTGKEFTR